MAEERKKRGGEWGCGGVGGGHEAPALPRAACKWGVTVQNSRHFIVTLMVVAFIPENPF